MMMNQSKSPSYSVGRCLLMLPLILLFLTAESLYASQRETAEVDLTLAAALISAAPLQEQRHSLQQPPPEKQRVETFVGVEEIDTIETEEIFIDVEVQPEFPGGVPAMMRFLSQNICYPVVAITNKIEGRVICQFVVKKDGTINDVAVVRGVDPQLDAEAKRVLELMPLWEPGIQQGEAVNVRYTVPVVFRLRGNDLKVITDGLLTNGGAHSRQITEPQKKKLAETEEIFIDVEVQPEFPGGMKEFMIFISENLKYPEPRGCQDIQGRVICSFVVMKDGTISDVKVVRGLHPHLDAEAIRVLQSMPKWKPGTHRGQAVDVLYTAAVVYRLQ